MRLARGGSCGPASDMRGTINLALSDPDDPPRASPLRPPPPTEPWSPNGNISFGGGTDASRTLTVSAAHGQRHLHADVEGQATGTWRATVLVRVISGSAANNTLTGSAAPDMIFARKGSDTASGRGANDLLCGGNGKDRLTGGFGADRFGGGSGYGHGHRLRRGSRETPRPASPKGGRTGRPSRGPGLC